MPDAAKVAMVVADDHVWGLDHDHGLVRKPTYLNYRGLRQFDYVPWDTRSIWPM